MNVSDNTILAFPKNHPGVYAKSSVIALRLGDIENNLTFFAGDRF